jgi:hypothetical protein
MPVLHQRDVRLSAADRRHDIPRIDSERKAFGLPQRRQCLVETAFLSQGHTGNAVDHRQLTPIAGGMERGGRLRQVLADDGGVADVVVADGELVMHESDGAGLVRAFGRCKGLAEQGDAARRFTACSRKPAVHSPDVGETRRLQAFARFRRPTEGFGRLPDVILEEVGLGQRASDLNLLVTGQPGAAESAGEQRRGVSATTLSERLNCLGVGVWRTHGGEYTSYTAVSAREKGGQAP